MSDSIEDFLRQVTQRPAQKQPAQKRPDIEILEPVDAEIIESEPVADLSSYVANHLNTQTFDERRSHMGESIGQVRQEVEEHLHDQFDHRVGAMDSSVEFAGEIPSDEHSASGPREDVSSPSDLVKMLSSPQSLRQAIILSEILARPKHSE